MDEFTITYRSTGLNNKVDPHRLPADYQTGAADLAVAVNVDIDDSLGITRRPGRSIISAGSFLCAFSNGTECFVIMDRTSDSALYQLLPDLTTLTGIRSGLSKGARASFCTVGDRTYYSNGFQNGFVFEGVSNPWPDTTGHIGANTTRVFYPAPVGQHIAHFLGCMWIAVDNIIYVSEFVSLGKFDLARRFFAFGSNIRMMMPVKNGVWISDGRETGFIARADNFRGMSWIKKSSFPAHEWSQNNVLVDLSKTRLQIPGLSAVWSSDAGQCIGTEDGQLIVVTEEKLLYPVGDSGATVVFDNNIINSVY